MNKYFPPNSIVKVTRSSELLETKHTEIGNDNATRAKKNTENSKKEYRLYIPRNSKIKKVIETSGIYVVTDDPLTDKPIRHTLIPIIIR